MWGGQGNDITSQLERRDWMKHQGHHILPSKSVGHLLLITEHREHEKFFL